MPDWLIKILEGGGLWGAITFVLMMTVGGLVAYVKSLQAKADKVYGYRLAERDTLNKVLSDTANVIQGIIKANEDRNDLTEEQSDLIKEQAHAFELLKASIVAQYDNIKEHNHASTMTVSALAEAVRVLSSMLLENRAIAQGIAQDVKQTIANAEAAITKAVRDASQSQLLEMRSILGGKTIVERKRTVTK